MNSRQILFSLAAVLVVVGIVLGMRNVKTDDISCGSVFSPSSTDARYADSGEAVAGTLEGASPDTDTTNNVNACKSAVSDAKPLAYGALGLGVVALIAAFVVTPAPADPNKPSMWR